MKLNKQKKLHTDEIQFIEQMNIDIVLKNLK